MPFNKLNTAIIFSCFLLILSSISSALAQTVSKTTAPTFNLVASFNKHLVQPMAVDKAQTRIYILNADGSIEVFDNNNQHQFSFIGSKQKLNGAMDLKIHQQQVFIADTNHHRIAIFNLNGNFIGEIKLANQTDKKPPEPLVLSIQNDKLLFTDRANHRACQIDNFKDYINQPIKPLRCFGSKGKKLGQFNFPYGITNDSKGYAYVIDVLNARVQKFNRFGKNPLQISTFGIKESQLYRPNGITLDSDNHLYISDAYLGDISVFKQGKYLGLAQGLKRFDSPINLRWLENNLWIVDYRKNKVYQYRLSKDDIVQKPLKRIDYLTANDTESKSADNFSQGECVSCHLSWQAQLVQEKAITSTNNVLPVASQKMCDSCHHGAVIDSRKAIKGYQHPSILSRLDKSVLTEKNSVDWQKWPQVSPAKRKDKIAQHFPLTEEHQLSCVSCHTPHNASENKYTLYQEHKNNWLRINNSEQEICTDCHQQQAKGADARKLTDKHTEGNNHPIKLLLAELDKPNANQPNSSLALVQTTIETLQKGLPNKLSQHGASLDANNQLQCQSCHQIHGGNTTDLLTGESQQELCASCHQAEQAKSKQEARAKGIHPVNIELDEAIEFNGKKVTALYCQTCHSTHDGSANTALLIKDDKETIKEAEAFCIACHQDQHAKNKEEAKEKNIHPINIKLDEPVTINNQEISQIGCLTCHSVHKGKKHTAALVAPINNGELCQHCHQKQSNVINSDHDFRITAKDSKNALDMNVTQAGVCGNCHAMHQSQQGSDILTAIKVPTDNHYPTENIVKSDSYCLNCHQNKMPGKKKELENYTHPSKDLILRSTNKKLPVTNTSGEIKEFGQIACKTCHDPHNWQPKPHQGLSVSKQAKVFDSASKNLEGDSHSSFLKTKGIKDSFCVDCHREETIFKFRYYHDKRSQQPTIDYID